MKKTFIIIIAIACLFVLGAGSYTGVQELIFRNLGSAPGTTTGKIYQVDGVFYGDGVSLEAGAGGGTTDDDVQVGGVDVDTTANFTDGGNIDPTLTDGGDGGPDVITFNAGAELITGQDDAGAFESGDKLLVMETGVGLKKVDYDDLPGGMALFYVEDGDGTEVTINNAKEWKFVEGVGIDLNWTDTSDGTDADPYDLTVSIKGDYINGLGADTLAAADTFIFYDDTGGTADKIAYSDLASTILGGTANAATHVTVTDNEDQSEENEVPFIEDASGPGNVGLESDSGFTYNPSTGTLTAAAFAGDLTGAVTGNADSATVATTVTITDNEDTAENNPLVFVAGADPDGGDLGLETDGTAYYTPSTGVITATGFAGALTGNVTGDVSGSSGSCTGTADAATHVTVTDNEDQSEENEIPFVEDASGPGNVGLESDSGFTYNPSTGTVTAAEFSGGGASLTGVDAATGDSATDFFDAGEIADARISDTLTVGAGGSVDAGALTILKDIAVSGTGLSGGADDVLVGADADVTITIAPDDVAGAISQGALANDSIIDADIDDDGNFAFTGAWDFGGGDVELPQASPAVPGVDGGIEVDFADGTIVVQWGSAHAELAASTDVVVAKFIRSFDGVYAMPDSLQSEIDHWLFKRIDATEFPHGIVITSITLTVSEDTAYTINVENWDDFDTINGANPTIDEVAYGADGSGEVTESTITYATIAAGQMIQIDLPTTDVGWIGIKIEYYEPAA